jgi:molecular chaperone GrpE
MRNIFSPKPEPEPAPEPLDNSVKPTDGVAAEASGTQDVAFASLNAECERLEKELAEHRDHLLRRQAEFDNFRRRTERERAEYRVSAKMDFVTAILPVLDGLEAALKTAANAPAGDIRKGVELVEKQLREILEKMGMTRIDALGKTFDHNLHHAVDTFETDQHPDHTVIDVYQQGYQFQDRLLRPAMVRVASNPVRESQ